jgi:CBS domain-containing protein
MSPTPRSLPIARYMATDVITVRPDMDVLEAMSVLIDNQVSGAPVVDAFGTLVGVLTERDCIQVLLQAGYHGDPGGRVEEYMTRDPETVDASASLVDVAQRFASVPFRRFPVLENGRLVGLVSRRDVLRHVLDIAASRPA